MISECHSNDSRDSNSVNDSYDCYDCTNNDCAGSEIVHSGRSVAIIVGTYN